MVCRFGVARRDETAGGVLVLVADGASGTNRQEGELLDNQYEEVNVRLDLGGGFVDLFIDFILIDYFWIVNFDITSTIKDFVQNLNRLKKT